MAAQMTPLAALVIKLAAGALRGYCWPMGVHTMPLAALAIKFGCRLPVGMLLADGGADGAFGNHGHQVWRRDICVDPAG